MNNVIPILRHRDTVAETIEEVAADKPDMVLVFSMKDGKYIVTSSNLNDVTVLIGALERTKHYLLMGGL